jgi:23S rRNA pseudouridine1911/1915/1917 synthase
MPDPGATIQFDADRGDARLRLDQIIVRRVTDVTRLSRNVAQRWIESGAVTVDGRIAARPSARVREGAAIAVAIPDTAVRRSRPEGEPSDLHVLYEDDSLIALDKPAGVVVHPSYKRLSGTLLNAVLWRIRDRAGARPGILTRLDKDTSGLVIVALTAGVHASLQRAADAGRLSKQYLAIVRGTPRPVRGTIALPLGRDPHDRRRVIVTPGGAASETRYDVLSTCGEGLALVRCELVTGRTHQIRVHMAARGWTIAGDALYGRPHPAIGRQALHAWRVSLPHPLTGEILDLEAPLPADMRRLMESANLQGP